MSNPERIIRLRTVLDRTGLSRTTLYRKIGEGTFPRQVPISVHGAGWYESAVNRWIEAEIRRNPAQYLWVHRRFKTRPAGEPSLYDRR